MNRSLCNILSICYKTNKKGISKMIVYFNLMLKAIFFSYLKIVCFLSGPTETILTGTSTVFSIKLTYSIRFSGS